MTLGDESMAVNRNGIFISVTLTMGFSPTACAFKEVGADMIPAAALPAFTLVSTPLIVTAVLLLFGII